MLAPRVVRPPWASSRAWKIRTITPRMLTAVGPNRIAARPVPVIWEQLPVTEGIFSEEITKMNAPEMAMMEMALGCSATVFFRDLKPRYQKGRHTANQNRAWLTGR